MKVEGDDAEGRFFSGDCYVVQYSYHTGSRDAHILYYWLGAHSGQEEQGTAALKAVELDEGLGGGAVQVRAKGDSRPTFRVHQAASWAVIGRYLMQVSEVTARHTNCKTFVHGLEIRFEK